MNTLYGIKKIDGVWWVMLVGKHVCSAHGYFNTTKEARRVARIQEKAHWDVVKKREIERIRDEVCYAE